MVNEQQPTDPLLSSLRAQTICYPQSAQKIGEAKTTVYNENITTIRFMAIVLGMSEQINSC